MHPAGLLMQLVVLVGLVGVVIYLAAKLLLLKRRDRRRDVGLEASRKRQRGK